ncbi:hypothetical protein DMENIID0001_034920 [Sergentomyia squamirostris]
MEKLVKMNAAIQHANVNLRANLSNESIFVFRTTDSPPPANPDDDVVCSFEPIEIGKILIPFLEKSCELDSIHIHIHLPPIPICPFVTADQVFGEKEEVQKDGRMMQNLSCSVAQENSNFLERKLSEIRVEKF